MLAFLLLVLLASTTAERDSRCARYKRGAQARTLPHRTDCTKFYMCDIQGNALEMNCPKKTYFSADAGICTFDYSGCTEPVVEPVLPIINKVPVVENSNKDRVRPGTQNNVLKPTLPIISNFNVVGNIKPTLPIINGLPATESNHLGSGAQSIVLKPALPTINNENFAAGSNKDRVAASGDGNNLIKPTIPIINSIPVVANNNQDRIVPENFGIGLLKPTLPIISNVPDNQNKERAAALGPICRNKNNGFKFPLVEDCFSYGICIQEKASVFTCPDGMAYDGKAAKCTDTIKCEMPKPEPPSKPTLTRPEQPEVLPQTPIMPTPQLPIVPPQAPVVPTPEDPVLPPQTPILPMPQLPVIQPQVPAQPKPNLPIVIPQAPTNPKPDLRVVLPQQPILPMPELPVIPPFAPILPMPELPVFPPQVPILPTPELPVIAPPAPILPMPELPVIPADPPKDTISGPIFIPYSAPRLIQDSRCSDRTALNSSLMLPAVGDCSKFVVCVGSIAYEKQCPVGQHWSTERNYCDFTDRAKCSA